MFLKKFLWACWFFGKNLAFQDPTSLKFHNRTDINTHNVNVEDLVLKIFPFFSILCFLSVEKISVLLFLQFMRITSLNLKLEMCLCTICGRVVKFWSCKSKTHGLNFCLLVGYFWNSILFWTQAKVFPEFLNLGSQNKATFLCEDKQENNLERWFCARKN